MDRSVDSIGSCSLDVDADSSDISDTSGSLNFPTPISIKDITREFTANIRERCSLRTVQTSSTAIMDPVRGKVRTVLTQPIGGVAFIEPSALSAHAVDESCEKKPSYLNLACCVNGYSNITTYDSKIRQDINKSREVSPIRPSSNSIQYCKKNNSLAPPVLLPMPTISSSAPRTTVGGKYSTAETNNNSNGSSSNGHENIDGREPLSATAGVIGNGSTSFIQQRVERLYGPGALAQGFYSPKKLRGSSSARSLPPRPTNADASELTRKFQELSPGKDYGEFRKKLSINAPSSARSVGPVVAASLAPSQMENTDVDLPVMRHLSQEFRAQLPMISPKKNFMRSCASKEDIVGSMNGGSVDPSKVALEGGDASKNADEVDHKVVAANVTNFLVEVPTEGREIQKGSPVIATTTKDCLPEKDGNHFIFLLKNEQARLLAMAIEVEKYIDALTDNPEISEDTFGLLRSASGKARLLVTQKMKQFEGLCHNNLNRSTEDKFPTTLDDLQGFWDMVNLQVDHIDVIFAEIEAMKNNNWKHPKETAMPAPNATKSHRPTKTVNNVRAKPASTTNGGAAAAKTSAALTAAALKRESQRKQLQEMRRKQRQALASNASAVESAAGVASDRAVEGNAFDSPVALFIAENGCATPN